MKNTISIRDKTLTLNAFNKIEFEEEIFEVIDMEEVVVVLTMPRHDYMTENRIYGVIDNKIAWRVQDMLEYDENCGPFMPDPYTGIDAYDKNPELIIAVSAYGFRFLIDPKTGKIVGEESFVK